MKTIKRTELQAVYSEITAGENFPEVYEAHGTHVECNWGGLIITLDRSGEACIVVRDWAGDEISISDILEIEFKDWPDEGGFFTLEDTIHELDNFMRV
jgi:hypothetical protein